MKKILYICVLISLFAASVYAGGGNRNGTAGATQLLVPVGTRGIAMGGSNLTSLAGPEAIYWNPANLARSESSTNVFISHMAYIADIGVSYGAISTNVEGFGAIGLAIKSFAVGEIDKTTIANPDGTGSTFTPQFMTVGLTYSNMLSDRIAVGLTANLVTESMDLVSATGFAFDLGISYANLGNIEGLSFGVVMKNIGPQMTYDGSGLYVNAQAMDLQRPEQFYKIEAAGFELPSTLELGVSYQLSFNAQNALLVTSSFVNNNFYGDEYKFGGEYSFSDMFFVRGGYSVSPELKKDENEFGITAGAGVKYDMDGMDFVFDYAYRDAKLFDGNHVFSLSFGL